MIEMQIRRVAGIHAAHNKPSTVRGAGGRIRRAALQLWVLIHAQALLNGTTGEAGDVAFIEDDRRRLAGRRAR
jgi:hypothetical protein